MRYSPRVAATGLRQKEVRMNISAFLSVLPYVVEGMLGIFAVTIIIIACIWLLNKVTSKK